MVSCHEREAQKTQSARVTPSHFIVVMENLLFRLCWSRCGRRAMDLEVQHLLGRPPELIHNSKFYLQTDNMELSDHLMKMNLKIHLDVS